MQAEMKGERVSQGLGECLLSMVLPLPGAPSTTTRRALACATRSCASQETISSLTDTSLPPCQTGGSADSRLLAWHQLSRKHERRASCRGHVDAKAAGR